MLFQVSLPVPMSKWFKKEEESLKELKQDENIVILNADKGNATVDNQITPLAFALETHYGRRLQQLE